MKKLFSTLIFISFAITFCFAQTTTSPVKWRFSVKMTSPGDGTVTVTARIQDGWHIYGLKKVPNGPVPTTLNFTDSKGIKFTDEFKPSVPVTEKLDPAFGFNIGMWTGNVSFVRHFKLTGEVKDALVKGSVKYMVCDDTNCMPPTTQSFVSGVKPFVQSK
ncbi:MAG: hypothetical protein K2K84_05300 [Muribaculaceae bacterium]|nr:hypothetical protein [Muribaculaceae bacterium]